MTATTVRIAIIEDNRDLREELVFFLQAQGHAVWGAGSAEAFWKQLHRNPVDIVLVDVGLPGEDGFSVVEYLHGTQGYGLILMTARGGQRDQLRGLGLGADVYLVKPVNFADLAATISELWRRMLGQGRARGGTISPAEATLRRWALGDGALSGPVGEMLPLTPQEYTLVEILMRHLNEICSKDLLHDLMFGYDADPDTHRIDVIVSRLRSKARQRGMRLPIRAVFGRGLVFADRAT